MNTKLAALLIAFTAALVTLGSIPAADLPPAAALAPEHAAAPSVVYLPMVYKPPTGTRHAARPAPVYIEYNPTPDTPPTVDTPPEVIYDIPAPDPIPDTPPEDTADCGHWSSSGPHPCRVATGQDTGHAAAAPGGPAEIVPPAHREGQK